MEVLRKELSTLKVEEKEKTEQLTENKKVLMEHREKLQAIIETCKALHEGFDEKRREVVIISYPAHLHTHTLAHPTPDTCRCEPRSRRRSAS